MDIPNFIKQDCLSFQLLTFRTKNKQRKDFKYKKLNSDFVFQHFRILFEKYFPGFKI